MTGVPSSRDRRVTVRLSGDDLAALPHARTLSEALRRALETQRERADSGPSDHDLSARLDRLEHTLARVLTQQNDAVPAMVEAAGGAPRAVRIEGFLFAITAALTRFLVEYSATHASIERLDHAAQGEPAAHADARWMATRERLLAELLDPLEAQLQTVAGSLHAPDNAGHFAPEQDCDPSDATRARAAE